MNNDITQRQTRFLMVKLPKFIMNVLFALQQPPIPIKSFTDDKAAKAWLQQFL